MRSFNSMWLDALDRMLEFGDIATPRGTVTTELLHQTFTVDMRRPVLTIKERKLSYRFMAAEAFWILTGDHRVASIASYNERIADYSDDGVTFFGAYGPRIQSQLHYVISALKRDSYTRQATLTIWRENPPETKDVPCTVAISFSLRRGKLNCHVFMRSSDLWLGLPYDVFNFSMLAHMVCAKLNTAAVCAKPGILFLTAASSHLYDTDKKSAIDVLRLSAHHRCSDEDDQPLTPEILHLDEFELLDRLAMLRDTSKGDRLRWWEASNG